MEFQRKSALMYHSYKHICSLNMRDISYRRNSISYIPDRRLNPWLAPSRVNYVGFSSIKMWFVQILEIRFYIHTYMYGNTKGSESFNFILIPNFIKVKNIHIVKKKTTNIKSACEPFIHNLQWVYKDSACILIGRDLSLVLHSK